MLISTLTLLITAFSNPEYNLQRVQDTLSAHVRFLSSDELEGRETSFRGQKLAANYLETQFRLSNGSAPFEGSFIQPFDLFVNGLDSDRTLISTSGRGSKKLQLYRDFYMDVRYTDVGRFEAPMVFAGYATGLFTVSLQGKWALVIEDDPNDATHANVLTKIIKVREAGAIGIMFMPHPESSDRLIRSGTPSRRQMSLSDLGFSPAMTFPSVRLTRDAASELIGKKSYDRVTDEIKQSVPGMFSIRRARVSLTVNKVQESRTADNVAVLLPGQHPDLREQYVVVSAHYDHLGRFGDHIFNGADDNATGTAALLTLIDRIQHLDRKRSLIVLAVSGEEEGLLGSKFFVANPPVPKSQIVANINIDMIGRNQAGQIGIVPANIDTSTLTTRIRALAQSPDHKIELLEDLDRYHRRSDHYSFIKAGIPALFLFSGVHDDYHSVDDDWQQLDLNKLTHVYMLMEALVLDTLNGDSDPRFLE